LAGLVDWWIGLHIRVYFGAVKFWDWLSSVPAVNSEVRDYLGTSGRFYI
jgi:hypothetical protein